MNLLATINRGDKYTGNESWVAQLDKYNLIYVEGVLGCYGSGQTLQTMPTAIYSPTAFKTMLDAGKATTTEHIAFLIQYSGNASNYRCFKMTAGYWGVHNTASNIPSIKIYGIK